MANDNRRESPFAAAARQMAEDEQSQRVPQPRRASPPPQTGYEPQPQQPAPEGPGWSPGSWGQPSPEGRRPEPDASAYYPPPPAYASGPPPAYQSVGEPRYSPWWKRVVATLIDAVVLSIPYGVLFAAVGGFRTETDPVTGVTTIHRTGAVVVVWLLSLVGAFLYNTLLEGSAGGATVGKMAMGIQVRSLSDLGPIGYGRAFGRRVVASVLWWLLLIPGLLDVLWPLWDGRRQTLHDKALGSVVVDKG